MQFRDVCPVLRYVRGDVFQPEHWRSLYHKLGLKGVTLEKLTFNHFLESAGALVEHAEDLKTLNARAVGEVAIREAIQEVGPSR